MSDDLELSKRCGTCLHWQARDPRPDLAANVRQCTQVSNYWDASEWVKIDGDVVRMLRPLYANRLAFVQDASDYYATLLTTAEFGCVQWQRRES